MAVRSTYVDVLKPTKMLNAVGMSSLVHQRIVANHDTYTMADWQDEIGYPWGIGLRFAVILSPCWLTIQSLITAKTVFSHWFRMWDIVNDYHTTHKTAIRKQLMRCYIQHDATIRILSLPLIYGQMSLHGVIRSCGIAILAPAGAMVTFEELKAFHEDMYEVSFMVADLYEAYALLVFGRLALKVVRQSLLKGDLDESELMA